MSNYKKLYAIYRLLTGPACECQDSPSVATLIRGAYDGEYPLDTHRCDHTTQCFNSFRACLGTLPRYIIRKIAEIKK